MTRKEKNELKRELKNVAQSFFETDEETGIAKAVLKFETPEDIFDKTYATATPVLREELIEHMVSVLRLAPPEYKVDLTLRFDDLNGYTEEDLLDIVEKNQALKTKRARLENGSRMRLANFFVAIGVLFFLSMILVRRFWIADTVWNDLFFYFFDIVTTVNFYQAATIFVVEAKERKASIKIMQDHFNHLVIETAA